MMVKVVGAKCQHCEMVIDGYSIDGGYPTFYPAVITAELARVFTSEHTHGGLLGCGERGILLALEPVDATE